MRRGQSDCKESGIGINIGFRAGLAVAYSSIELGRRARKAVLSAAKIFKQLQLFSVATSTWCKWKKYKRLNRGMAFRKGEMKGLEKESIRYFDQKSGLWYIIHWDDVLKCYVTQLVSGQQSVVATGS